MLSIKPIVTMVGLLLVLAADPASAETSSMRASWYGPGFQGNLMANGKPFNMNDPTVVAHKSLPFGTKLKLTNPETGQTIVGEVQDRGPYITGRQLDLSWAAAEKLGFIEAGTARLEVQIIN